MKLDLSNYYRCVFSKKKNNDPLTFMPSYMKDQRAFQFTNRFKAQKEVVIKKLIQTNKDKLKGVRLMTQKEWENRSTDDSALENVPVALIQAYKPVEMRNGHHPVERFEQSAFPELYDGQGLTAQTLATYGSYTTSK